jgi:hypothetical protein
MNRFINREHELQFSQTAYQGEKSQFINCWIYRNCGFDLFLICLISWLPSRGSGGFQEGL